MRLKILVIVVMVLFVHSGFALAEGDYVHEKIAAGAVEVGNKISPVSGEEIGKMGPSAQYEYAGKSYNFYCIGCVEEFKKDPEKYVKIVEEQMGTSMKMGQKQLLAQGNI